MMFLRSPSPGDYTAAHDAAQPSDEQEVLFRQKVQHLWKEECLVDVTLACENKVITAHKLVLSAYSDYFKELFMSVRTNNQYPIVFMKDVQGDILEAILEFMYCGEVNVTENNLNHFMRTARTLKIKGLSASLGDDNGDSESSTKRRSNPLADKQWPSPPPKRIKGQMIYNGDDYEIEESEDHTSSSQLIANKDSKRFSTINENMDTSSHVNKRSSVDRNNVVRPDLNRQQQQYQQQHQNLGIKRKSVNQVKVGSNISSSEHEMDDDMNMDMDMGTSMPSDDDYEEDSVTSERRKKIGIKKTAILQPTKRVALSQLPGDECFDKMAPGDEEKLVRYVDYLTNTIPVTPNQVRCFAWGIDSISVNKMFSADGPSKDWWISFRNKYPRFRKMLRPMDFLKRDHLKPKAFSFKAMADYRIPLQEIMAAFELEDKPDHIWSCCEYALNITSRKEDCILPSRERYISHSRFNRKDNYITFLFNGSASGKMMPPFTIFQDTVPSDENLREGPACAMYDNSTVGLLTPELFLKWFEHMFLPQCPKERSVDHPVVLLINSTLPLVHPRMLDLALSEHVVLLSLMPHLHNACQPMDLPFVRDIRPAFKKELGRIEISLREDLSSSIPAVLKYIMEQKVQSENVREGFRVCGIFPLPTGVDRKEYLELQSQLNFNMMVNTLLGKDDENEMGEALRSHKRKIKQLSDQNDEARTSDEEEEFEEDEVGMCHACGKEEEEKDAVKCSKKACKKYSCKDCLPVGYDPATDDFVCIDCRVYAKI